LPQEWSDLRFHAQFRFENPCEQYGRNYVFLDASGRGMLVGATFGISMQYPQPDAWYHGGGDTLLLDGESQPAVLHGIGAEDFFGHSWGVQPFHSRYVGTPYEQLDAQGRLERLALYRFFVQDPIFFSHSLRASLGALGNAYSSVAYWYQQEPHRPFFRTPPAEARMPNALAPYGTYDLDSQPGEVWMLLAPLPCNEREPFETPRPLQAPETGEEHYDYRPRGVEGVSRPTLPGSESMEVRWRPQVAQHGFVDFNAVARPALSCICLQTGVVGYALRYVDSPCECDATLHLAFDDEAAVWVNEAQCFHQSHRQGLQTSSFGAHLRMGRNRILVKLSNEDNTNWRFWGFNLRIAHAGWRT
jgi:hypothetical protein